MKGFYIKIFLITCLCWIVSCKNDSARQVEGNGEQLVQQYCSACHPGVEPSILPKTTWQETVLPRMGHRLGVYSSDKQREELIKMEAASVPLMEQLYPKEPIISKQDWERLSAYIIGLAPDSLPFLDKTSIVDSSWIVVPGRNRYSPPSTSLVQSRGNGQILLSDINTNSLMILEEDRIIQKAQVKEGLVQVIETPNAFLLLQMGSFSPSEEALGSLMSLPKSEGKTIVLADKLQRPVHMDMGDIDQDGDPDISMAEFGKHTGALSLFRNEKGALKREKLDKNPGCTKTFIRDIDLDGDQDIVALFAQGNERISAYLNNGKTFSRTDLITFHPSMGSTSMTLLDWDQDEDLDILYTAGDNADYSPVLKPYHGIYIYENKGDLNFEQVLHLPFHGAYKALAVDFDQDGDLDIAAISFFPDFRQNRSGFAYFENLGEQGFQTYNVFDNTLGRWIVMDTADVNQDNKPDLVLGSLMMEVEDQNLMQEWLEKGVGYTYLINQK
jgi:hypothetical protein